MRQLGLTYQKVGARPAKAGVQTQEDFKKMNYYLGWNQPNYDHGKCFGSMPHIWS